MRFDLSDDEWASLEPLMPKSRRSVRANDRRIMNAIFYVLRTGMPWRDLPERYGPYTTAYNRFNRWSRRGIWKRIFDTLAAKSRDSLYLIDSTIVKAHRAALAEVFATLAIASDYAELPESERAALLVAHISVLG